MQILLWIQTALAPSTTWPFPCLEGRKITTTTKSMMIVYKKLGLATSGRDGEGSAIHLHPNSCNMEDVIITVAHSKWEFFGRAGEERISCSLAGRQGAMSALIRSACSARTHICGLWTLHNRCLSYSVLPIQHVHLIHPWGGTICIQRMYYRYYQRPVVAQGTALVTAIWKLHIA